MYNLLFLVPPLWPLHRWNGGIRSEEPGLHSPPESSFANQVSPLSPSQFSSFFDSILINTIIYLVIHISIAVTIDWDLFIFLSGVRVAGGRGGGADEFGGGCGGIDGGLLKLRDDVQMCGYKDVEIMWNMLSISLQPQLMEEAGRATTKAKRPRRGIKDRSRLFFWTNHSP